MSRGGSTRRWRGVRAQVLDRDGGLCRVRLPHCCTIEGTEAHHLIPVARGGEDELENLVACCKPCNLAVGDKTPGEVASTFFGGPRTPLPPTVLSLPGTSPTRRVDH